MRLFSKADKNPKTPTDKDKDRDSDQNRDRDKSRARPRPRDTVSPRKKSTSSESSRSNEKNTTSSGTGTSNSNSNSTSTSTSSTYKSRSKDKDKPKPEQGSPRSSNSSRRFPKSSSSRRAEDPDTHPLNLPFDQLQKRLSALSASPTMPDAMDVDVEAPSSMPGSFDSPKANGVNGNHADEETGAPEPPPHKSNPASPAQDAPPTPEQAEAFKALGNKYYKAKEYGKAIDEYTKGRLNPPRSIKLTAC